MSTIVFYNDIPENFNIAGDLAIDTETMGLKVHRDRLCLLQMSNGDGDAYLVNFIDKNYAAPNLKKLLLDKNRCKIFHYARFDLAAIKKYLEIDLENIFCTKISSKLVRTYTDSHGLKDLCRELLSVQISKQQQSSYWGRNELTEEQKEYAAKDVLYLHQLRSILQDRLLAENRLDLAKQIFKFLPIRANLDLIGWNDIDIFMH
ncbi:MAG TPA: ribonuclease H-like domain-containing protein [Rickettsia endosymbiont of Sericostoma sp.]|uniref:ribonuclease D n=1 Tax=unclassified Candidatus Tisiphia TaxID=2996318 RepID=UPI001DEF7E10|nr:ribonuclease H-like domain-containing protein [Candidatus Tisiphia sp.]HJD57112.1 ribonuclease H-like domain-containing protein [Rickettsia endosymbiont of Sericostoma sp. HW-2014]HJD64044.1 ribonuclease H-like domain-containing protein [Rickettsia endosymbiont of Sericostoma sp.]